jgi:hypothetical protein
MELRQLLKLALRWWWLIALPPLLVGAYGLATYRAPQGSFTTSLRFTAAQPDPVTVSPNFDPNYYRWLTSEYIVSGLKDWVRTGAFAKAVSEEMNARGVSVPAGAVAGSIASDAARSVLVVYLTWPDQAQLTAMAEAVIKVLRDKNGDVFPQFGGQPAQVVALDNIGLAPVPPSLRARFDLVLKVGLGLVVGLGLALAAHYFDPFVRGKAELEGLGIRVVAEIPRIRQTTDDRRRK